MPEEGLWEANGQIKIDEESIAFTFTLVDANMFFVCQIERKFTLSTLEDA